MSWLAFGALLGTMALTGAAEASTPMLTLSVRHAQSGAPLANQNLYVYEVDPDGTVKRLPVSPLTTNAQGQVVIPASPGKSYYLKTMSPGGQWVTSSRFTSTSSPLQLLVGSGGLAIQPGKGTQGSDSIQTGPPPSSSEAGSEGSSTTGSTTTSSTGTSSTSDSNSTGISVGDLGPAASTDSNSEPVAMLSSDSGEQPTAMSSHTVVPEYLVYLRDAQTGDPLANQDVYAYEVLIDGSDLHLSGSPLRTDAQGRIILTNLETSRTYYVKARVYNGRWSVSRHFSPQVGGQFSFLVGTLEVHVVDARTEPVAPLANTRVTIQEHTAYAAGPWRSIAIVRTDGAGYLRLDLPSLGQGLEYRLSVEFESEQVTSDVFSMAGSYVFPVAGEVEAPPLTARQRAHHVVNRLTFGMTPKLLAEINALQSDQDILDWIDTFIATQLDAYNIPDDDTEIYLDNYSGLGTGGNNGLNWFRDSNSPVGQLDPLYFNGNEQEWQSNVSYSNNAIVRLRPQDGEGQTDYSYPGEVFRSLHSSNLGNAPVPGTTTAHWATHDNQGYQPNWQAGVQYQRNDVVRFRTDFSVAGELFVCSVAHFSSESNKPTPGLTVSPWTRPSGQSRPGLIIASTAQLQQRTLRRMFYSERQLLERLTWFIENHFSTDISVHGRRQHEMHENNLFRANALGKFRTLVHISSKSTAMLYYLNSRENRKNAPNENYARELMELHCMGVDRGYTNYDLEQAARALTGWREDNVVASPTYIYTYTPGFRFVPGDHDYGPNTPTTSGKTNWTVGVSYALYNVTNHLGKRWKAKIAHVATLANAPPDSTHWEDLSGPFVLGVTITPFPNNSVDAVQQGEQAIDIVCDHPSTSTFITWKLLQYFVADDPPQDMIDDIAAVFSATDGDLRQVLAAIFTHGEFYHPRNYRNKIKSPLEFVASLARNFVADPAFPAYNLGTYPHYGDMVTNMRQMGMALFEFDEPTGFPEIGIDWLNTNYLLHAYRHAVNFAYNRKLGVTPSTSSSSTAHVGMARAWLVDLMRLFAKDELIDYLAQLAVAGDLNGVERQICRDVLEHDHTVANPYDPTNDTNATERNRTDMSIRAVIQAITTSPKFLYH